MGWLEPKLSKPGTLLWSPWDGDIFISILMLVGRVGIGIVGLATLAFGHSVMSKGAIDL